MGSLSDFMANMDWQRMLTTLFSAVAALICLTIHELCHGLTAYRLGDPTAKMAGRLTLNPIRHIDPFGLILMVTAGVGWAKPVPVDMRYFKAPKRDMAITALAGPVSNFLLAWLFLLLGGGTFRWMMGGLLGGYPAWAGYTLLYLTQFLENAAILSVGLGVFNLFPVPPLDGSRVVFALLPDRAYYTVMAYERYVMVAVLAAVWLGWLDKPLTFLISHITNALCAVSFFPFPLFY